MKKLKIAAMVMACAGLMQSGIAADKLGVTIYKYDDNFMATMRQSLENLNKEKESFNMLMKDSQNSPSVEVTNITTLLSQGVKVLAVNIVDPGTGKTMIKKIKKDDLFFVRFGYIYTKEDFIFKTFYTKFDFGYEPFIYLYSSNPQNIKNQKNQNLSFEFDWKHNNFSYNLNTFYRKEKNTIDYNYENTKAPSYTKGISFSNSYNFDFLNRIDTNVFVERKKCKSLNRSDTFYGANIRLLNTFEKFDFYNELVYRGGYDSFSDGYDYNFAITYKPNMDFSLFVKGQNIFDKALKNNYKDYSSQTMGNEGLKDVTVASKRFLLGMEYKF
ncbi:MAG: TonB-dependent receptor [Gammaproteobacteria bacterium]|nr:TonB-dependent receptor [Gammaproteobacteria bacterium]